VKIEWNKVGIKEFAAIISSHLKKNDIEVVLVGGACVSIYSNNKYLSHDIDLITDTPIREVSQVLKDLDFVNIGSRLFENPKCRFIIDFPAPPVSIGDTPIRKFNSLKTRLGTIQLLTPTDCVKDRLAAYYFWNDQQSLDQAIMVAKHNKVNLSEVKEWSKKYDGLEKYEVFIKKHSID